MFEVIYTRRTDLPSVIARLFTGGARWSHCGVVVDEHVIEAQMIAGVTRTPIYEFMGRYPFTDRVQIDCPNPQAAEQFALDQVGKPYDWLGMLGAPWRSHWQDESKWYCSELVEACLTAGGRNRWRLEKHGISPMESWNCK